ncbi:hypothetical protein [Arthrobacter crystallopoietes]|uniref:hypothetical protein n=1 Tax=Crystallibacter crystallopoietes TaxID=37928 RepID=UPI0011111C13|nr:hypothetical protein [Arthrobacter crystallopoietes]
MIRRTATGITDEPMPGTKAVSRSIVNEELDVYVYGTTREEYDAWVQQVMQDETMSPKERDTLIRSVPEPEETYEERMERAD